MWHLLNCRCVWYTHAPCTMLQSPICTYSAAQSTLLFYDIYSSTLTIWVSYTYRRQHLASETAEEQETCLSQYSAQHQIQCTTYSLRNTGLWIHQRRERLGSAPTYIYLAHSLLVIKCQHYWRSSRVITSTFFNAFLATSFIGYSDNNELLT